MTEGRGNTGPWEWRLLEGNCTGCGICADVCEEKALEMPREAAYPKAVPGKCTGCGTCARECPFDALRVEMLE